MLPIILSVIIIICVIAIVWLGSKLNKSRSDNAVAVQAVSRAEQRAAVAEANLAQEKEAHARQISQIEQHCKERIDDMRLSLSDSFKTIADQTLEATIERQQQQASQSIQKVINPLREAFDRLSDQVNKGARENSTERSVLKESIASLQLLNTKVGEETRRLSQALRGNTGFQGRWGEMVLENILEASGLEAGRWVIYQQSTTTDGGARLRPDAIVHCPRGRDIIIDSKVSLKSYLDMLDAQDDVRRKTLQTDHLRSIENHLRNLSGKEYQSHIGLRNSGFVIMFIPHEGAYLAAMQTNPDLWQKAYERNVVMVSPTHLVTVVRLVEQMWQTEDQTANTLAIAEEATKMLDQLNDFLTDLSAAQGAMDKARDALASAHKRLATGNGNVIRRANRLQALGIKTKKALPLADDQP